MTNDDSFRETDAFPQAPGGYQDGHAHYYAGEPYRGEPYSGDPYQVENNSGGVVVVILLIAALVLLALGTAGWFYRDHLIPGGDGTTATVETSTPAPSDKITTLEDKFPLDSDWGDGAQPDPTKMNPPLSESWDGKILRG